MHFFLPKNPFLTQISKRSTHTDLHHPPLHLAQFFSLESLKISSAYSKTSLGLKIEKFFQTNIGSVMFGATFKMVTTVGLPFLFGLFCCVLFFFFNTAR